MQAGAEGSPKEGNSCAPGMEAKPRLEWCDARDRHVDVCITESSLPLLSSFTPVTEWQGSKPDPNSLFA